MTSSSTSNSCLLRLVTTVTTQTDAIFLRASPPSRKSSEMNDLDLWFESAKKGEVKTLCKLLEDNKVTDVDVQDSNHRTALYLAAKRGRESCVTALLDLGADPNSKSAHGMPGHAALEGNHMTCLALLLRRGADLETKNHNQETLLQCIKKKYGQIRTDKLLEESEKQKRKDSTLQRRKTMAFVNFEEPIKVESGLRAPVPQVLSLEIESYEQHVYSYEPFSFYIKGKLRDGYVTLKRYRWEVKEAMQQEQFHHEVNILSDLRHPNILLLMAVCNSPDPSQQGLVLEPVERAFLGKLLHEEKTIFREDTVLGFIRDIACAMQFVHQRGYIHCYLGSSSVVLTENFRAKICNFEYAQRVQYGDSSGVPISHLDYLYDWMAPEQLSGKPADQAGDVFSFGILVWECVTRRKPLKYVKSYEQLTTCTTDPRLKKIPRNWSHTFKILIGDCLKSVESRPIFQQIYGWLSAIVTSQYACVRPKSFVLEQHDNLFSSKT